VDEREVDLFRTGDGVFFDFGLEGHFEVEAGGHDNEEDCGTGIINGRKWL
jgi:hypothetical protein